MPKAFAAIAALCLAGAIALAAPAAQVQDAAPAASLVVGAKVYDQNGEEVGKIAKVWGDRVAVSIDGALKPGAEARSADGAAVLGKVTGIAPQSAVLTTSERNITMPRAAFFLSARGLAMKVDEKQFLAGVRAARAQKKGS